MGKPWKSKNKPLFVGTDGSRLKIPELAGREEELGDLKGCRIPSLISSGIFSLLPSVLTNSGLFLLLHGFPICVLLSLFHQSAMGAAA